MNRDRSLTVRIPADLYNALEARRRQKALEQRRTKDSRGVSISDVVREALEAATVPNIIAMIEGDVRQPPPGELTARTAGE